MLHVFTYRYKEILYTCHPLIQVEFVLLVAAEIDDKAPDEINILRAVGKSVLHEKAETELIDIDLPDESTREGAMFWALLKESGRNHFYKLQKNESIK